MNHPNQKVQVWVEKFRENMVETPENFKTSIKNSLTAGSNGGCGTSNIGLTNVNGSCGISNRS